MAFRIRDLMISVLPQGAPLPGCDVSLVGCRGTTLPNCAVSAVGCGPSIQCRISIPNCAVSIPNCAVSDPGCGFSVPNCGATLFGGGCGNDYTCNGCTNTCDAGCSRVQCSNYPTNNFPAQELTNLREAKLALLKAEMRLAQEELNRAAKGSDAPMPQSREELDFLEKRLEDALEELRAQREKLGKESKKEPKKG